MSEKLTEARRIWPTPAMREAMRRYYPCNCGIHICDIDHVSEQFVTAGNLECRTDAEARELFDALRQSFEARDDEPEELYVDLMQEDGSHVTDFSISRQMLGPLLAAGRLALEKSGGER